MKTDVLFMCGGRVACPYSEVLCQKMPGLRFVCACVCLLSLCALSARGQEWTAQDSLQLRRLLDASGEIELNPDALLELKSGMERPPFSEPRISAQKPWMDFDTSLPTSSSPNYLLDTPEGRARLSLTPYKPNTPYNWDPIRHRKIAVGPDTWRNPMHRFMPSALPGNWREAGKGGMNLMLLFTKDFWSFKQKQRRRRTLEALQTYGDSVSVRLFSRSSSR